MIKENFPLKMKALREKRKLTQQKLASILSIDRSTIAKWETGEALPRTDMLLKLASTLKCKTDDLF